MRKERSKPTGTQERSAPLVVAQVHARGSGKGAVGRKTLPGLGWRGAAAQCERQAKGGRGMGRLRVAWALVRRTIDEWVEDNCFRLAAALAYYTVFSISPLLVIAIGVAGAIFGHDAARRAAHDQL